MYSLFVAGVLCWLIWGLLLQQWPVILANLVTFALSAIILSMKIYAVIVKHEAP
jgi:MtN3 and saliva related transmembrane protein